jgi:RNA polymerase sigma factor (sigma-70 family)
MSSPDAANPRSLDYAILNIMPRLASVLQQRIPQHFDEALTHALLGCEKWAEKLEDGRHKPTNAEADHGLSSVDRSDAAAAWVAASRIAFGTLRHQWRRQKQATRAKANEMTVESDILETTHRVDGTPGADFDTKFIAEQLQDAVNGLDARYREALWLKFYEGLEHPEIAELLGVPKGTVDTWVDRGKKKLKQLLGEAGERYRDVLAAKRSGAVWGAGAAEFEIEIEILDPAGTSTRLTASTTGLRWYRDGSVRAEFEVDAGWPPASLGVLMASTGDHANATPLVSLPFLLQPQNGIATLLTFLGEPPAHSVRGDYLPLPLEHASVLLAR